MPFYELSSIDGYQRFLKIYTLAYDMGGDLVPTWNSSQVSICFLWLARVSDIVISLLRNF